MKNNNNNSGFKTGDLVIGSSDPSKSVYSATGAKVISDGVFIYGDERNIASQQREITKILTRNGGTPLKGVEENSKKKKIKKTQSKASDGAFQRHNDSYSSYTKIIEEHPSVAFFANEIEEFSVQFENDFGKMRAKVESVIEHDMAFMLTFKDEEAMVFEPKVGESLFFYTRDKSKYQVYYPGVTFNSPEADKRFMILFKVPEENQE